MLVVCNKLYVGPHSRRAVPIDTIRDAILTCALKLTRVCLIYRTKPTTKYGKKKNYKVENRYAQKCQQTVWGIHVVSPEEDRKATVGRICRKGTDGHAWAQATIYGAQ